MSGGGSSSPCSYALSIFNQLSGDGKEKLTDIVKKESGFGIALLIEFFPSVLGPVLSRFDASDRILLQQMLDLEKSGIKCVLEPLNVP